MDNNEEKTKLCELCLVCCDEDFVVVDDDKRKMLETVRLEVGISSRKELAMCKSCAENVEKCFEFKSLCLDTENCITSFSSEGNNTVDLTDIYLNRSENKDKNNFPKDHTVCRLCLELIEYGSRISLSSDTEDKIVLNQFFPELDLNIIRDPSICALCHMSLQDYFDFMKKCLDVHTTVQKPCADETDSSNESKFSGQPDLMLKNTLKYENEDELEIDRKFHEHDMLDEIKPKSECLLGTEDEEFFFKSEPIDNEMEPIDNEMEPIDNEMEPTDPGSSPSPLSESRTVQAKDNKYHCKLCAYKTDHKSNFQRHTGVHQKMYDKSVTEVPQEPSVFQCKTCPFKTKYRTSIRRHILRHKPPTYKCDICDYNTISKYSFENHLVTEHDFSDITQYHCECCNFKTAHKNLLNRHRENQHSGIRYSCKLCPFRTMYKYRYTRHMILHQDESEVTIYSCEYCDHKTKHKGNLAVHLLTHKINEPLLHQCRICPFKTRYMTSMRRHMASVHKEVSEQQLYSCDQCEFETTSEYSYSSHLLSHQNPSNATIYWCRDCEFTTRYRASLKRHRLVHQNNSEVNKYRCDLCQFETKYKNKLCPHMLVHQDESKVTMYGCEHCKFKTKYKSNLGKHFLTHKTIGESLKDT